MIDYSKQFLKQNWYYTYLKGRLEKAKEATFNSGVLISGSSHALCGINENIMHETVSCSLHSQDIYYDYLCVKSVLENLSETCSYKTCILVMGYYIAFQDLSLSKYSRSALIARTYYPIFKDAHNWETPDYYDHWQFCSENLSDEEKKAYEREAIRASQSLPFYSSETVKRRTIFDFAGKEWAELSKEEKDEFGKRRGEMHNYLEEHTRSFEENKILLNNVVSLLNEKSIRMIVVVTPFTPEYRKYVSPTMKSSFFHLMNDAHVPEVIDFNDDRYVTKYCNEDFLDTDHLNENGAEKFSKALLKEIR